MRMTLTQSTQIMKKKYSNQSSSKLKRLPFPPRPRKSPRRRRLILSLLMQRKNSEEANLRTSRLSKVVSRLRNWRRRNSTLILSGILSLSLSRKIQTARMRSRRLRSNHLLLNSSPLNQLPNSLLLKWRRSPKNRRSSRKRKSYKHC